MNYLFYALSSSLFCNLCTPSSCSNIGQVILYLCLCLIYSFLSHSQTLILSVHYLYLICFSPQLSLIASNHNHIKFIYYREFSLNFIIFYWCLGQVITLSEGLQAYVSTTEHSTNKALILYPDIYGWNEGK